MSHGTALNGFMMPGVLYFDSPYPFISDRAAAISVAAKVILP